MESLDLEVRSEESFKKILLVDAREAGHGCPYFYQFISGVYLENIRVSAAQPSL